MKKILNICFIFFILVALSGCNNINNTVNIDFIIGAREETIIKLRGESITLNDIKTVDHEHIIGMFYDSDYVKEYKDEPINEDTTIYVKVKDGSKYLMPEKLEKEILDIATGNLGSPKDYVSILYYFGEYNGIHIFMLKDGAGYPGDGENHGTRKLYYYKDKSLNQLRLALERLIDEGYFTYEDYYEFKKTSEMIFKEIYG